MSSEAGFSTKILLNSNLTQDDVQKCLSQFLTDEFLALKYGERNTYESFESILKLFPNRPRYSLKYKDLSFIVSCSEGNDFLILNIDDGTDSEKILTLTESLCRIVSDKFIFAFTDKEGHSPRDLGSAISKLELKWLFKYNYFGIDFIDKYGKEFFTNMPCIKDEFVAEDIIRIDLCKDIFSTIGKPLMNEVSEYLNGFSVKVSFYNNNVFLID